MTPALHQYLATQHPTPATSTNRRIYRLAIEMVRADPRVRAITLWSLSPTSSLPAPLMTIHPIMLRATT